MYVKQAVVGGLVGLVIVIVAALSVFVVYPALAELGQRQETPQAAEVVQEQAPTYRSPAALAAALQSTEVRCTNFAEVGAYTRGEIAAGECFFDGTKARIGIYGSREAVRDGLSNATGRDAYGRRLLVLAGENWVITMGAQKSRDSYLARIAAKELGGSVVSGG